MPYKIRNTIVLIGLLIAVIIVRVIINSSHAKKIDMIENSNKEKRERLKNLKKSFPNLKDTDEISDILQKTKEEALLKSKIVPQENNPILTYQYLLDICNRFCPDIDFDYKVSQSGKLDNTSFNSYNLTGKSDIKSLYTFINQLESQPLLYAINTISISEESSVSDTVKYSINIQAFYEKDGIVLEKIPLRKKHQASIQYNPFYPRIHPPISGLENKNLVNINNLEIVGITPENIFYLGRKGKVSALSLGEKVAYGYLDRIDMEEQKVVFVINKIGIDQEQIIYLNKKE